MSANCVMVIKVGGSLLDWKGLPARLKRELEFLPTCRVVLIVGGGPAADFVRVLDSTHGIGEKRSHGLALRSLDLTANVVAELLPGSVVVRCPDELPGAWDSGLLPILAPRVFLEEVDRLGVEPLPETWDVTTDSIAARLAVTLGADELRLLKSVGLGGITDREGAAKAGLVDPMFPVVSAPLRTVTYCNLRDDHSTPVMLDASPRRETLDVEDRRHPARP